MNRDWVAYVRIIGAVRRYLLKTVADKAVRRSIMRYIGSMDREEIVKTGTYRHEKGREKPDTMNVYLLYAALGFYLLVHAQIRPEPRPQQACP